MDTIANVENSEAMLAIEDKKEWTYEHTLLKSLKEFAPHIGLKTYQHGKVLKDLSYKDDVKILEYNEEDVWKGDENETGKNPIVFGTCHCR